MPPPPTGDRSTDTERSSNKIQYVTSKVSYNTQRDCRQLTLLIQSAAQKNLKRNKQTASFLLPLLNLKTLKFLYFYLPPKSLRIRRKERTVSAEIDFLDSRKSVQYKIKDI